MISRSKWLTALSLIIIVSFVLVGCEPETVIETVEVPYEVEVEKPVEVEVLITPTPEPIPQGGTIVHSTFADATTFNPILWTDTASSRIGNFIYEALVAQDPFTGELVPNIAESWTVSDDGLVYTFTFREDVVWSDGTPLTANDFKFTYDAVGSDLVETVRKSNIDLVESIEVLDDYTVVVTFTEVDCTALTNLGLGILPSHIYAEDFSDIMDSPENIAPSVASGPFIFQEWIPDDHATLVRNESYFKGAPNVDGLIVREFADTSAELAALLAGETDVWAASAEYVSTVEAAIASGQPLSLKKTLAGGGYTWLAMNYANPDNPMNGWLDENENETYDEGEPRQEQDPHPILADPLVREAISHAVDVQNIVNKVALGQGIAIASSVSPAIGWAFDETIQPYAFDLETAKALLDEAGWVEGADGIRVKDGMKLELTIQTNAGNQVRENIMVLVQETLNSIGFDVEAEAVEFGSLVGSLLNQTYDLVVLGWSKGADPDDVGLWEYRFDTVGSGFNFTSYYNEDMEELGQAALTLPGCDPGERAAMYKETQQMLHTDMPYVFLYAGLANTVWNDRLNELDPGTWALYHNTEELFITP